MRYALISLAVVCSLAAESQRERDQAAQIQVLQQKLDAANAALTRGGIAASKSTAEAVSSQAKNAALTTQHTADKQQHTDDQQQHSDDQQQHTDDTRQHTADKQRHTDDVSDGEVAGDTRVMVSTLTKMFAQQAVKSDKARRLELIVNCEMIVGLYLLNLITFAIGFLWLKRDRVERWANVQAIKHNVGQATDAANHNADKFHATNEAIAKMQAMQQETFAMVRSMVERGK
jgi:hypothetical protein